MAWLRDDIRSPLGMITCVTRSGALVALDFEGNEARLRGLLDRRFGPDATSAPRGPIASAITRALEAYFEGDLGALDRVPVELAGTSFEVRVLEELRRIPRGEVVSYAELARRVGRPDAARAVGAANGRNPISIVVPCHRVIGARGDLTGYAGGLDRKRWLLRHEGALVEDAAPTTPSRRPDGA